MIKYLCLWIEDAHRITGVRQGKGFNDRLLGRPFASR